MKNKIKLLIGLLLASSITLADSKEVTMGIQMVSKVEPNFKAWWARESIDRKETNINLGTLRIGEKINGIEKKEIYIVTSRGYTATMTIPPSIKLVENNTNKEIIIPLNLEDENGSSGSKIIIKGDLNSIKSNEILTKFKNYNNLEGNVDQYFGAQSIILNFLTEQAIYPSQPGNYRGCIDIVITPSW